MSCELTNCSNDSLVDRSFTIRSASCLPRRSRRFASSRFEGIQSITRLLIAVGISSDLDEVVLFGVRDQQFNGPEDPKL